MGVRIIGLHKGVMVRLAALVACLGIPLAVSAQAPPPGVFSEIQTAVGPRISPALEPATIRSRVAQVDTQKITAARRGREVLKLNLFDDAVVEVQIKRVRPTPTGYFISGRPKGMEWGDVRLVVNGPVMVGTVETPEGTFTIRSAGSGRHVIRQLDPAADSFECEVVDDPLPVRPERRSVSPIPPEQAISSIGPVPALPGPPHVQAEDTPTESGSEVRILVVYTQQVRREEGGDAGARALIDLMVQSANQAFEDGGINPRLVLAHAARVEYTGVTTRTDLVRLRDPDDGYMDEVHALRNRFAADLVHLLTDGFGGGSAWRLNSETLESDSGGAAFAVTASRSEETFTHEVGHNFGLRHDRYINSPESAIYPYAFGYTNTRTFETGAPETARWRTIMAYANRCRDAGFFCPRLFRFSNPDQSHEGDPLGVAAKHTATGPDGPADARLTINKTARWVGSFRSEACTDFAVTPATHVAPRDAGEIVLHVDTAPGCLWEASDQSDFLTNSSDAPSAGSGRIHVEVQANLSGAERTGTLVVAGTSITVRQLAADAGVCNRSAAVRLAITKAAGFREAAQCDQVTEEHLARIDRLSFQNQGNRSLKEGDFDGLSGLQYLALSSSDDLTELPDRIFSGLSSLQVLHLSNSHLAELPTGVFSGLSGLQELHLSNIHLAELPTGVFSGLSGLQKLYLIYNDLNELPAGVFSGLSNLQELNLFNNNLAQLPRGAFSDLSNLKQLQLGMNPFNTLPAGIFEGLSRLESLGFWNGELTELPANIFTGLNSLQVLDLTSNPLTELPAGIFEGLSRLERLSFWNGELTELPADIFSGLSNLQELDLFSNHLTELPANIFAGLSRLEQLILRANDLRELPPGLFSGLTALERLNLSRNEVEPLPFLVSLEKVGGGQFKAVAPTGAPFTLDLPLHIGSGGEIEGGASHIVIPAGAVESAALRAERVGSVTDAVSADIRALPDLPADHSGYALVKDESLPLRVVASSLATDATLTGLSLSSGKLDPVFAADSLSYTAYVANATSLVTVKPSTSNANATVAYLDAEDQELADADASADGHQVRLEAGENTIKAKVTAQDGASTQDYMIRIIVDGPADVCTRTKQVRDAIMKAVDVAECADVTEAQLSQITQLLLHGMGILSLQTGDFAGLSGLGSLWLHNNSLRDLPSGVFSGLTVLYHLTLYDNQISRLPADIFSDLTALQYLLFFGNQIRQLPAGIFSGLTALRDLTFYDNQISRLPVGIFSDLTALQLLLFSDNQIRQLPAGIFSDLTALRRLGFHDNQISRLPVGIFSDLTALQYLSFSGNQISQLPEGAFSGLTALERLFIARNAVDPLPLVISLEKVGDDQFRAVVPAGAPFTLDLPIHIGRGGEIEGGASHIVIPAGAVESAALRAERVGSVTDAVSADIGTLPDLPFQHKGYALDKDESLPREVLSSEAPGKDVALRRLSVSGVPPEASSAATYQAKVTYAASSVTVTAEASNANATLNYLDAQDQALADADASIDGHQVGLALGENTIRVKVTSEDATVTRTYTILITRNSPPEITTASPLSVQENVAEVATLEAADANGDAIRWHTNGGADVSRFDLTPDGALTFKSAPDYEAPADLNGDNEYTLVVWASDGTDETYMTLTVTVSNVSEEPGDASLSGLVLSDGTLDPVFASATTSYTARVANAASSLTVAPATSSPNAAVAYRDAQDQALADADASTGGHQVGLAPGENTIKVTVTAEDGTTMQTYVILVTRNSPPEITTTSPLSVQENTTEAAALKAADTDGDSITWSKNGGDDADHFDLTPDGVLTFQTAPDYEAPADADGDNGYVVIVRAYDGVDAANLSLTVNVTDVEGDPDPDVNGDKMLAPPAQVTGVEVVPGFEELAVSWDAVSDASGYKVQWKSGEAAYDETRQAVLSGGDTVSHTIAELTPGTQYAVRVIATKDNADDGEPSEEVTGIPTAQAPAQVTGVAAVPGFEELAVSWDAVSDADGYTVQWKSGEEAYDEDRQAVIAGGDTVSYTIAELMVGTQYTVRVIATKDNADEGPPSSEVTGTPKSSPPAQVRGLETAAGIERLDVIWTAVSDANGYKVQWKSGDEAYDGARQAVVPSGDTLSHTIADLSGGTEYTVRVLATKDNADDGLPSEEVSGIPKATPPAQVTGVAVEPGFEELEVSWDAVSDADGYEVQWKSGSEDYNEARQVALLGGETTSYTIIDLTVDTEYTVRVIATKEYADDGPPSEEVTATLANPDPDVNADGTLDGDDAQVMYQAYASEERVGDGESGGTAALRRTLLSGLAGTANPSDDDLKAMLRRANVWRSVGVAVGGDINEDGAIDGDDAFVMYYAYEFADLVGDGETGGTARHRQHLLSSRSSKDNPTDQDLKRMLRRANALRDEFG